MSAEKINTTATIEQPPSIDEVDIEQMLSDAERHANSSGELVPFSPSSGEIATTQPNPSTEIATIPKNALELPSTNETTTMQHRAFGNAVLAAVTIVERYSAPAKTLAAPLEHSSNISNDSGERPNYERGRYYYLYQLMGKVATKFGEVGGAFASDLLLMDGDSPQPQRKASSPTIQRPAISSRPTPKAIESAAPQLAVPATRWDNLFSTLQSAPRWTAEAPKAETAPENTLQNDADSLLNKLAQEKYGANSWKTLSAAEQTKIRSRALIQLHPDRGGDQALFQQVESMIGSQPLTAPLKGRPEEPSTAEPAPTEVNTDTTNDTSHEGSREDSVEGVK